MPVRDWQPKTISDLRGAWSDLDQIESRPNRAVYAQNVRIAPGRLASREGYAAVFAAGARVSTLYNWVAPGVYGIASSLNRLVYVEGTTAKMRDLSSDVTQSLFTQAGMRGMVVAEAGDKAFLAPYKSDGSSAGDVRISLPLVGSGEIDKAFAPPWAYVPTVSESGAGRCTAGEHRFGYVVQTRTGFYGQPSPVAGGAFQPVVFTNAADKSLHMQVVMTNIPPEGAGIHAIMTRVDNPEKWFFVPGATANAPGGASSWTAHITIDISDDSLEATAESADAQFDCIAQPADGGSPPISVSCVVNYGNRMVYIADNKAYISERDDYQFITEAAHVVQTPGQKRIVTAAQLRGSLYLFGPAWTYETADNGNDPGEWATPSEISGSIGTKAVRGVIARTTGDFLWVISERGLELFDGRYQDRAITWLERAWRLINWNAAYCIHGADDTVNQRVYVAVPLGAATECSHLFVIDYSRGKTPETCDITVDVYKGGSTFSSFGVVQDEATKRSQIWIGPSAAGNVTKQSAAAVDGNGFPTDDGVPVTQVWESGFVLNKGDRPRRWNKFGYVDVSASGAGQIAGAVYGAGRNESDSFGPLVLSASPEDSMLERVYVYSPNATVRLETSGRAEIEELTVGWKPAAEGA